MNKLLVVVDMQRDFIDGSLGTPEAKKIVDNVVNKIENFDGAIIATMDTHHSDYLKTREGKFLPVEHCVKNTKGWEIDSAVMAALKHKGFRMLEKPTFGSVELPKLIMEQYNSDKLAVELVGLCTDICVVSNAMLLKAAFPEMDISVDAACCAGVTPQKHEAALETMKSCQIVVK